MHKYFLIIIQQPKQTMTNQSKDRKQDYELIFNLTAVQDFRQSLYDYKQNEPDNYHSVCFKSSMKHFPKYYFFYQIQEYQNRRVNHVQIVLLKQKEKPTQMYSDYVKKHYHQKFGKGNNRLKCKPIAAIKIDKKKGENIILITILHDYFDKNYEQSFGRQAPKPYHVVRFFKHGYCLSEKQQIKIGKINYLINGIRLSDTDINSSIKKKKITHISDCQNITKVNKWVSSIKKGDKFQMSNNQKDGTCKICIQQEQEQGNLLIIPCKCVQPVHMKCLQNWMKYKLQIRPDQQDMDARINHVNYSKLFCEICKVPLPRIFIIDQYIYEMIYFQDNLKVPYLVFSKLQKGKTLEETNQEFAIQNLQEPATLGRYEENGVQINDPSISRKHSDLVYSKQQDKMIVRDLGSKFGTLVKVDKTNNMVQVKYKQRRGFQIQSFLLVAELVKKNQKNEKNYR